MSVTGPWSLVSLPKGLCNNYQEGGAEKLELSSKNLDSTPPPKQKKIVLTTPLLCEK